jgi:hypothetical protein
VDDRLGNPPAALTAAGASTGRLPAVRRRHRMVETGAVFDVIGAILCVVGVAVMANVVGLV